MIAIVLNRYQNRFFELLPIFFVVLLFSGNSLPAQHLIENPFQWLEAIQSRSLKIQADSLEQTISRNIAPPFFYDLLLQRYLMLDSLDHAEQFFQRRIRQQPDDNFAAQTLANLYQHGHDPQITAQAFRRALDAGQPSWGLIDDIFAFNQRFPEHAISQHIFAPYFSSKTDLLFVRSLAAYHEGNYKTVISNLANVYKNNTLPLELFKRYGHSFEMARQRNRADSLWQELLHSLTNQKNEYQIAAVLEKRATNYLSQNRMEEAVVLYDSALVIAKKLGDFGLQQRILGNKGHALRFMNDLKSAAAFYTQALDIAEKLKEPLYCYFWYQRLGEIRLDESRFDETLRMLDKAQHAAQDAHYFRGMVSI
ncbi:MAG: tetratricopeptide repeat protein, partial [Calditrichaeota bacterium]|nr:tetratricopeptide repeat protein [Calditrichota bacterium]